MESLEIKLKIMMEIMLKKKFTDIMEVLHLLIPRMKLELWLMNQQSIKTTLELEIIYKIIPKEITLNMQNMQILMANIFTKHRFLIKIQQLETTMLIYLQKD